MKTYTQDELKELLRLHSLWLQGNSKGKRIDLSRADLSGANLCGADLRGAYLSGADLRGANLRGANLRGADLRGADLREANLRGADLRGADLSGAYLSEADLSGAYLSGANLCGADLSEADLSGAYLSGANLCGADLSGAYLSGADLPHYKIVQDNVSILGYKKSKEGYLITLKVSKNTKRMNSLIGRKCRAEKAKVIKIEDGKGNTYDTAKSLHDNSITYTKGKIVKPDSYDDDIRIECTNGIHFFITPEEAWEY